MYIAFNFIYLRCDHLFKDTNEGNKENFGDNIHASYKLFYTPYCTWLVLYY